MKIPVQLAPTEKEKDSFLWSDELTPSEQKNFLFRPEFKIYQRYTDWSSASF